MINTAVLQGYLFDAPQKAMTPAGAAVVTFRMGWSKFVGQAEHRREIVAYANVAGIGGRAEWAVENLHKGDLILVQGELRGRNELKLELQDVTLLQSKAGRPAKAAAPEPQGLTAEDVRTIQRMMRWAECSPECDPDERKKLEGMVRRLAGRAG